MDRNDREVIDGLFGKIRQAEDQTGSRDAQAEALIREHITRQPAAPYYMAQAIVIQEQALAVQQARIEELERQLAERPAGGGFLSSLFGGGAKAPEPAPRPAPMAGYGQTAGYGAYGAGTPSGYAAHDDRAQGHGALGSTGGFMAGALQTAMAVAGGVLIGNALAGLLAPEAEAEEPPAEDAAAEAPVLEEEEF